MATLSTLTSVYNFFTNSDTKELIVPMYQRKYSWEKDQILDFISDFNNLFHDSRSNKYHFFGLVVIVETEKNSKRFEIIDGQQRITTICLLIAIFRDFISDLSYHSEIQSNPKIKDDLIDLNATLNTCLNSSGKLKLTTLNESLYESDYLNVILGKVTELPIKYQGVYASQQVDEKSSFNVKIEALSDAQTYNQVKGKAKSIRKNYQLLNEEFTNLISSKSNSHDKAKLLKDIVEVILNEFKLIPFTATDQAEAFSLFETLNDRGLDVAAVDLIKNLCLTVGRDEQHRSKIFNNWKSIFIEDLKELDGITFLRYSFNSRHTFITKSELYKSYSKNIRGYTPSELDIFLGELKNDAINYKILQFEDSSAKIEFRNILRLLKSTNTTQYIVLALSIMRCVNANVKHPDIKILEKKSIDLLQVLHKLILSIIINGQGMNQIERFIPSLSLKLDDKLPLGDLISIYSDCEALIKNHIDQNRLNVTIGILNELNLESNSLSLCLINAINYVQLPHSHSLPQNLTLEHVYPVKPKAAEWPEIEKIADDEKRDRECLYSIGNHIPLLQALNSEAQNKKFDDKKEIYDSKSYQDYKFNDHNLNIYKITNWTPDVIEKRKLELNEILLKYLNNYPK